MKNKVITISVFTLLTATLVMSSLSYFSREKTAYFDYNTAYNECDLKKSLETDLEKLVSSRKSELDSLQMELSFLSNKIQTGETNDAELTTFEDLKNRYLTMQNRYEEENIRLKETYFAQIRTDINEKAKSFAAANGYDYLFAAVGDGSLMYANESDDVTSQFLDYLNK